MIRGICRARPVRVAVAPRQEVVRRVTRSTASTVTRNHKHGERDGGNEDTRSRFPSVVLRRREGEFLPQEQPCAVANGRASLGRQVSHRPLLGRCAGRSARWRCRNRGEYCLPHGSPGRWTALIPRLLVVVLRQSGGPDSPVPAEGLPVGR